MTTDLDRERGLYDKYRVEKVNGKPVGECFVLEAHDPHAVVALREYAKSCGDEFPQLATDLTSMANRWSGPAYVWSAKDFVMVWDDENTFPFIEDEDANGLYGFGHHDKDEFAAAANRFDFVCGLDPEDCSYTAADVQHLYAAPSPILPEERFTWKDVTPETPGAFPLTLIYR